MDALTLTKANDLIRIAMEKAAADYGRPICVAVCDASGFLVAFQRMEGAPLRSIAIAQGKAYSAARMQVSTDALLARLERENIPASYFCDDKITALPGGSVLKDAQGDIVGAAGISGLTSAEDQEIADHLSSLAAQPAA
ncbi:MAG: GlcG/HbpS family heme-binding protein [Rhodomicrobium sp.]